MVTNEQLKELFVGGVDAAAKFHDKLVIALAEVIVDILKKQDNQANNYVDTPEAHALRLRWAVNNMANVKSESEKFLWILLIANKTLSKDQIESAEVDKIKEKIVEIISEYCVIAGESPVA